MAKRKGKFYYKNEKEVMQKLGLEPTLGSGSFWIQKEDGENEDILAQLKSTDKESINVNLLDLEKLEYHARISHKIPIFIIQFLNNINLDSGVYLLLRPSDLHDLKAFIDGVLNKSQKNKSFHSVHISEADEINEKKVKKIKSSQHAKQDFWEEQKKKWRR